MGQEATHLPRRGQEGLPTPHPGVKFSHTGDQICSEERGLEEKD